MPPPASSAPAPSVTRTLRWLPTPRCSSSRRFRRRCSGG
jgi:hypothetical protein